MKLAALVLSVGLFGCSARDADVLHVFIYADYFAPETISRFERETGSKVTVANFASGQELCAKVLAGGAAYDVVFPSDDDINLLAAAGALQAIDASKLPNLKNLGESFRRDLRHGVPYMWGTTGIAVNTKEIKDKIDSWSALWDPKYKNVSMLNDAREAFAAAFRVEGLKINATAPGDIDRAKARLIAQKANLRPYNSQPKADLVSGQIWLCQCYSGDALQAANEGAPIEYVIPKEGATQWIDFMAIPKAAKNAKLAHAFIDYLLRDDVSADLSNYIGFANPNDAARAKTDKKVLSNPIAWPPAEALSRCERLRDIGPAREMIEAAWAEVRRK